MVCGRCRNCLAGRRHLCADTKGIGVNRPGAFAEYISVPMTNVWHHDRRIDSRCGLDFRSVRQCGAHRASFPVLGEDVLITGAGPIGIMAAAVVRHARRAVRRGHGRQPVPARAGAEDGGDAGGQRDARTRSPTCRRNSA